MQETSARSGTPWLEHPSNDHTFVPLSGTGPERPLSAVRPNVVLRAMPALRHLVELQAL